MTLGTDSTGSYTAFPSSMQDPQRALPPPSTVMASWALGLALLPIPVALCFSIGLAIAVLVRCSDGRNHGKKRAIAAITLSVVWIAVLVAAVIYYEGGTVERDDAGTVSTAGHVPVGELAEGDCMPDGFGTEGLEHTVELVPCSEPHTGEVYSNFTLDDGAYPGDDEVVRLSEGGCIKRLEDIVGMSWDDISYEMFYYYPLKAEWSIDREVSCIAISPEPTRERLKDVATDDLPQRDSTSA